MTAANADTSAMQTQATPDQSVTLAAGTDALTAADRCDTPDCGAQAYLRATFTSGSSLVFCRHHGEAHRPGLELRGAGIETFYDSLFARPDASA
jgi:hypothetical protein